MAKAIVVLEFEVEFDMSECKDEDEVNQAYARRVEQLFALLDGAGYAPTASNVTEVRYTEEEEARMEDWYE